MVFEGRGSPSAVRSADAAPVTEVTVAQLFSPHLSTYGRAASFSCPASGCKRQESRESARAYECWSAVGAGGRTAESSLAPRGGMATWTPGPETAECSFGRGRFVECVATQWLPAG
jgi:hypothetical protein